MKSTGEVMSIDQSFEKAFSKTQIAVNNFPNRLSLLISIKDQDKSQQLISLLKKLLISFDCLFFATEGTYKFLLSNNIPPNSIQKVNKIDVKPSSNTLNICDILSQSRIDLIINTTSSTSQEASSSGKLIRKTAISSKIPHATTISAAYAMIHSLMSSHSMNNLNIISLQSIKSPSEGK